MIYSERYRSGQVGFGSEYYGHLSDKTRTTLDNTLAQLEKASTEVFSLWCRSKTYPDLVQEIERGSEMFGKISARKRKESGSKPSKRSAWLRGATMGVLLLVSVVLIFVMIRSYYVELDNQLFDERSNHLQEITEKVADIFDITIARSWDSVNTFEQFLYMEEAKLHTEDDLMRCLKDTSRFRTSEDNVFLLLDDDFRYYTSDGNKGYWRELPLIIQTRSETQELITTLPYQNSSLTYMCFLKQLPEKFVPEATGKPAAYVMLAVNINSINDGFSVNTFGSRGYTYIVNRDGRILHIPEGAESKFKAYNIVKVLENEEFIHGGNIENFRASLQSLDSAVMEFRSDGTE